MSGVLFPSWPQWGVGSRCPAASQTSACRLPYSLAVEWECVLAHWHGKCAHIQGLCLIHKTPWSCTRKALWSMFFTSWCCLTQALAFWFLTVWNCASWCYISGYTSVPCSALCYSLSTSIFFCDKLPFISSPWLVLVSVVLRYSAVLLLFMITMLIFADFILVGQICSYSWCLWSKFCGSQTHSLATRKASRAHICLDFKPIFPLSLVFCLDASQ